MIISVKANKYKTWNAKIVTVKNNPPIPSTPKPNPNKALHILKHARAQDVPTREQIKIFLRPARPTARPEQHPESRLHVDPTSAKKYPYTPISIDSTEMLRNLLPVPSDPERKLALELAGIEGVSELIRLDWEQMRKLIEECYREI